MNPKIENQVKEVSFALYEPNYEVRTQHFTFIYYKNRILKIGKNNKKTNPINLRNLSFRAPNYPDLKGTCSEWDAINKLKNTTNINFNKVSLINVRIDRNHNICIAKPCRFCENLIKFINPKEVFYSNEIGEFEKYII